jgi:PAS domain S-box-containing protein
MSRRALIRSAIRLSLLYFLFGFLWILLSDRVLAVLVPDPHAYAEIQTLKGWFYVAITSLLFGLFAFAEMRSQEKLRSRDEDRERRYRMVVETAQEGIVTLDADSRITYVNPAGCAMFGIGLSDLVGKSVFDLISTDFSEREVEDLKAAGRALEAGKTLRRDVPLRGAGGASLWCRIIVNPLFDAEGRYVGAHALVIDIQFRLDYEAQLVQSLKEKEALLRELNHRVKNNLQLLASLLSLRVGRASAETGKEFLLQHLSRIKSISLVYDRYQESASTRYVDFSEFARDAVAEYAYAYEAGGLRFVCDAEPGLLIGMDAAVPLALAMDEAVQNSVAHAFPAGRGGTVTVGARRAGGFLAVTVRDDGVGFDTSTLSGDSIGVTVLQGLAEQLGGKVDIRSPAAVSGRGTSVEFLLPSLLT